VVRPSIRGIGAAARDGKEHSVSMDVFVVVLDYRGGAKTDALVARLRRWNPSCPIHVLDNGSPDNASAHITHRNDANSHIGGGIVDCLTLAKASGATHLMFIANDVTCTTPLTVAHFVDAVERDPAIVHASAAVTPDSTQARAFPWMVRARGGSRPRAVRHADILVSLLDVGFIDSFGGFPPSRGGWGYSWELAHHASQSRRRVVICDRCVIRHVSVDRSRAGRQAEADKFHEARAVYRERYGGLPWESWRAEYQASYRR
jgi:hypothetical protein